MKKTLPVRPFLTSRVISALASSTSARTSVETCAVASLTRSPMDGSALGAWGSTSGIEVTVVGTPFLRSLTEHFLPGIRCRRVHVATWRPRKRSGPTIDWPTLNDRAARREGQILRTSLRCLTIFAVIAAVAALTPHSARADDRIPLGGGSGIVIEGETLCTLTAIGNDNQGNLIGFTSAHCGGPGERVAAEGAEAAGVLGTMVAGNESLDYAVIQFDPRTVQPVNTVKGFEIDGIGPDPGVGDIA